MVMRKDRFYLYDKGTIATVYGGMLFLNGILVALCVFFTVRFRSVYKELHADRETGC